MRYDELRPATVSPTRSLKAVDEPRTISESRIEMSMVKMIDLIGREVRGST